VNPLAEGIAEELDEMAGAIQEVRGLTGFKPGHQTTRAWA